MAHISSAACSPRALERPAMVKVALAIEKGSMAYLARQIKTMFPFVVVLALGLFLIYRQIYADAQGALTYIPMGVALAFLMGVAASYGAGFVGMWLAVKGNVRSANAALTSFKKSMELAFQAGAVSGMFTVAFGLLGRDHHLHRVSRERHQGPGGLRIRREPRGALPPGRRRHLHQGRRRRRRSRREGRGGNPGRRSRGTPRPSRTT